MAFISLEYAVFVVVLLVLYYILPKKIRWISLLLGSYYFYFVASKALIAFLLLSTVSIYVAGIFIDKEVNKDKQISKDLEKEEKKKIKDKIKKRKKLIVILTVILNFAILAIFKYTGFMIGNINQILNMFKLGNISIITFALPLGISYYTLMAVSYIVDVYRGKYEAEKNPFKIALYLSFFPSITQGPITKYEQVGNQLYEAHKFDIDNIIHGASLILLGVFKKIVIADRAGIFVNQVFAEESFGIVMFLGAVLYTLQIYAEFAGCMDIVIGTSRLFGIELAENFNRPFFSRSIQEFWRRWHITLGAWIKEYIFYPVSLSKMNMNATSFFRKHFKKEMAKFLIVSFPLLFVWLYNGIWHGASWKYVAYGMYYYLLIIIGILLAPILQKIRQKLKVNVESKGFVLYEILRTTMFVIIGMMMFRSSSFTIFIRNFANMFKASKIEIMECGLVTLDFIILIAYVIGLIIIGIFQEKGTKIYLKLREKNVLMRYLVYGFAVLSIVIFGIYGEGYDTSNFIYGQF